MQAFHTRYTHHSFLFLHAVDASHVAATFLSHHVHNAVGKLFVNISKLFHPHFQCIRVRHERSILGGFGCEPKVTSISEAANDPHRKHIPSQSLHVGNAKTHDAAATLRIASQDAELHDAMQTRSLS